MSQVLSLINLCPESEAFCGPLFLLLKYFSLLLHLFLSARLLGVVRVHPEVQQKM
jgi:hypothetical protein